MAAGYAEFEIDIPAVFRAQLPRLIEETPEAPLTCQNVSKLPEVQGCYVLYHQGEPVYVGKTDAEAGFQQRLRRHVGNLAHRRGISPADVSFKAVRIMVFHNFDVETILIRHFQRIGKRAGEWNNSGFGSNDPGRRREGQIPARFDVQYPINIDEDLDFLGTDGGPRSVLDLLVEMKQRLPYVFRYETDLRPPGTDPFAFVGYRTGHADQRGATAHLPSGSLTARSALRAILKALPWDAWQATVLPGRLLLYKERQTYGTAVETFRSSD